MGKKGFTILGVSVGALVVLAIGGYFLYQNLVNTPKNAYLMAELDNSEEITELVEERFEDELEWYENSMKNLSETSINVTAETNDPSLNDMGLAEIINNAEINLNASQDIEKEMSTFDLSANINTLSIEDVNGYITGDKLGLTLPFIEEYLVVNEEDAPKLLHETNPENFEGDEEIDFSTFFQSSSLTEEERDYFVDEYSKYMQENLPDEAFESAKEEVKVGENTVDAEKLTMTLTEEQMHDFLKGLFNKMAEDEKLVNLVNAQLLSANFGMPAGQEEDLEASKMFKQAASEVEDLEFPNGLSSVVWQDGEGNIVKRDFDVSVVTEGETTDIALGTTNEVREDGNLITSTLTGNGEEEVVFVFDLNEVENGYEDTFTVNAAGEEQIKLVSTKSDEDENTVWNLEAAINQGATSDQPLKLFMESSTNYASDQASGDIQLYAEDGQTITKDTAVINITHESSTISEVEIPSSDNEKDLGKMSKEELEAYFTDEVQPKFEEWARENFGGSF